jgi:hypothetical protein
MSEQKLHPDAQTYPPDTEYFFLGSGKIQAGIQWSRNPDCTPLGIVLSMPDQFSRKWGSLLFHPELGLERTMVTVIIDGVRYKAEHADLKVCWGKYEGVPNVLATWHAGDYEVSQSFCTAPDSHALIEWVGVMGVGNRVVEIETALYANPTLFSSFGNKDSALYDAGYNLIYLSSLQSAKTYERYITVTAEPFDEGNKEVHLVYATGVRDEHVELQPLFEKEKNYWSGTSNISSPSYKEIVDAFNAAKYGLRAVVASSGRFDASIWQYGMEWGRDAAMVTEALIYSGQFELAKAVVHNILTKLSNDEGMVAEASRFRGGADSELDSNGLVLRALYTYYEWTGDELFIKEHWQRITAIADYLLRPEFLDEKTGMLKATRDISERNAAMGIKPGYDVAHQTFGIIGLLAASSLALDLHDTVKNDLWKRASEKMQRSFLSHPTHSMIADNKIIKRRLLDGSIQRELHVERKKEHEDFFAKFLPKNMPLDKSGRHALEPDTAQCFPIIYEIVDPGSEIANKTMQDLEKLWSQGWEGGGYGRYDISGEPDSPGPWALATCFMAQAYFEMGENEKAMKAVDWLIEKAGSGGSWFEFYGDRPTPPLPPTGILIWAWAQFITLVVKNILGAKIEDNKLHISSRMEGIEASLRFRDAK